MTAVAISCIVCTYNRQDFILHCLEAFAAQSLASDAFEVIVVDNHSTDRTGELVRKFIHDHPGVRMTCAFEEKLGLSNARNTGARLAKGDVLAYIDDDAVSDPRFLEEILRVFQEHPAAGCVGGRIDLSMPDNLPWWYSESLAGYYSAFNLSRTETGKVSELWELPYGANFSVAKKALLELGGFSTRLGRKGKDFSGGEETELAFRMLSRGYEVYYCPFARVTHYIKKERISLKHMVKTARSSAKAWVYVDRELIKSNRGFAPDLKNAARNLFYFIAYPGPHPVKKRFQFFIQTLHNFEKARQKILH